MKKYLFYLIIFLGLTGCDDFLSTTLDVDLPKHEDLLVAEIYLNNITPSYKALITKTFPVGEFYDTGWDSIKIQGAFIGVWEAGQPIFEFFEDTRFGDRGVYRHPQSYDWKEGVEYRIEVEAPNYPRMVAYQTYPKSNFDGEALYIEKGGVDIDGFEISKINLTVTDPAEDENFYMIELVKIDTSSGNPIVNTISLSTLDPLLEMDADYSKLFLPDGAINGKTYKTQLEFPRYSADDLDNGGFIILTSITEDAYRYNATLRAVAESFDLFTEPVLLHTNFDKGLGCFLLSNAKLIPLER